MPESLIFFQHELLFNPYKLELFLGKNIVLSEEITRTK